MKKVKEKTRYIKVPLTGAIFFSISLAALAFFSGFTYFKNTSNTTSKNTLDIKKTVKPVLKFFVMSFCPYGNQIETTLKPVVSLLGDKAEIQPQYIFEKITDLKGMCQARSGDINKCSQYVQSQYFKTEAECKKAITANLNKCLDEKSYIKSGNTYYSSLHGRGELNQGIREICAWGLSDNKTNWWNFVDNVNTNCNYQNVDSCWEDQAKKAGLDTNKITECFNKNAIELIEKEIALTDQNKITASPTLLINDAEFPPENAYTKDGTGTLTIGKKTIPQSKFRTSDTIKEALCASFKKSPKECKTVLTEGSQTQTATGGCQ